MHRFLAVLAPCLLAATSASAGVTSIFDERDVFFRQTAAGFVHSNTEASFDVTGATGDAIVDGSVTPPGGRPEIPLLVSFLTYASAELFHVDEAAQTAALPGGDYSHVVDFASGASQSFTITEDLDQRPAGDPRILDFAALATLDPTRSNVLKLNPFTNFGSNGSAYFEIDRLDNTNIFTDGAPADFISGDFTVPAGTLTYGQSYYFAISWSKFGQSVVDGAYLTYDSRIITNGGFTLNAAPGIPEPAAWAMMLVGFGVIGTALRRSARPARRHSAAR